MKELIFNVKNAFESNDQDGCLAQYDSKRYYIPAYQRGYKWGSDEFGAVSVLLNDLWDGYQAYKRQERKEYYLQYITVKKTEVKINGHSESCLEVIDGQQRLTTLSIIISVLNLQLNQKNISIDKLHYAIRENFFSNHIYKKEDLVILLGKTWDELIQDNQNNKQDIFYLFSAAKKVQSFFKDKNSDIIDFIEYLLTKVMLIVNSVESHVDSEKVFKNLNSNRVPLTETELVKALLITKVGRENPLKLRKNFTEILEIRMSLGRQWDEMTLWANKSEIKTFFFNGKEGMQQLLILTAISMETDDHKLLQKEDEKDYPLFNFFHKNAKSSEVYQKLKSIYLTLKDWYANDQIYNLMGFCKFVKDSKDNTLPFLRDCFNQSDKHILKKFLSDKVKKVLPDNVTALRYGEDNKEIHAVLLALSIFKKDLVSRFDFHQFVDHDWTLEHIFPQKPEGKKAVLTEFQISAVTNMLGDNISDEIILILDKPERTEEEKETYYLALQKLSRLNTIGNMCLLTGGDNGSNGCRFFKEKRQNVLELIQKGSFVPKHTFDVFSKMIPDLLSEDLKVWSKPDMDNHIQYINRELTSVLKFIEKTISYESR